jgi:hypothetical protein
VGRWGDHAVADHHHSSRRGRQRLFAGRAVHAAGTGKAHGEQHSCRASGDRQRIGLHHSMHPLVQRGHAGPCKRALVGSDEQRIRISWVGLWVAERRSPATGSGH